MLQAMQEHIASTPSSPSPSFLGLLTALAEPASAADDGSSAWNGDGLADDVATLSYERVLRSQARYKSSDPADPDDQSTAGLTSEGPTDSVVPGYASLQHSAESGPMRMHEAHHADLPSAAPKATRPAKVAKCASSSNADVQAGNMQVGNIQALAAVLNRNQKCASITIRLSEAECAQLRKRAAEAGLTVSAYMRFCTFEAESLRALVKDTLAQLRSDRSCLDKSGPDTPASTPSDGSLAVVAPALRSRFGWLQRFWPNAQAARRVVRA
jgi:hypothetical protein